MTKTITITSKGQTTIPAEIRRKLGVPKSGGALQIIYNDATDQYVISRVPSIDELSQRISSYIEPGITPITDVDEYYQAHRGEAQ